jgi:hypothetical protein
MAHEPTARSMFLNAWASCGYSSVIENFPCGHALKQMGGYMVCCLMAVDQLQRFYSVKLYEGLIMPTELETTREKTATVKFEEVSPVIRVSIFK